MSTEDQAVHDSLAPTTAELLEWHDAATDKPDADIVVFRRVQQ